LDKEPPEAEEEQEQEQEEEEEQDEEEEELAFGRQIFASRLASSPSARQSAHTNSLPFGHQQLSTLCAGTKSATSGASSKPHEQIR